MFGAGLPVAVAAKVTLEEQAPWAALTVMLPGQEIVGATFTTVVAVAVSSRLSGSGRVEETTAVLSMVPDTPLLTFTTSVKLAVLPEATLLFVHTTLPVPPTDGAARRVQPDGVEAETN